MLRINRARKMLIILVLGLQLNIFAETNVKSSAGSCQGVLFYAGFDGTTDAVALGDGKAVVYGYEAGEQFGPGIRGQALLSGDSKGSINYNIDGNILLEQGSIEFWMNPQDWFISDNLPHKFHVFFEMGTGDALNRLIIYVHARESWFTFLMGKNSEASNKIYFRRGEWNHIVATWDKDKMCLYHNGIFVFSFLNPCIPKDIKGRFWLGDRSWAHRGPRFERKAHSLIDEFYIYNRALSQKEITWAYQHATERIAGEDIPEDITPVISEVNLTPFSSIDRLEARLKLNSRWGIKGLTGRISLLPENGSKPGVITQVNENFAIGEIKLTGLPAGRYQIIMEVNDSNTQKREKIVREIILPDSSKWLGNKIGIGITTPPPPWSLIKWLRSKMGISSATPPPPWPPIELIDDKKILVWNRQYELGNDVLLKQAVSSGKEMLYEPIKIRCVAGGRMIQWQMKTRRLVDKNQMTIRYNCVADSEIGRLEWKATAEFDGMIRYDLTLKPRFGAKVDLLELVFPIKEDYAKLHYLLLGYNSRPEFTYTTEYEGYSTKRGIIPPGPGVVYENSWAGYWWVGDEERGLAAFCESDQAWDRIDRKDGFRIERRDGIVNIVWSFTRQDWRLPDPWKFTFGLQATPVKPVIERRQPRLVEDPGIVEDTDVDNRLSQVRGGNMLIKWNYPGNVPYHGYAEAMVPDKYKKLVDNIHKKAMKISNYSNLNTLDMNAPEAFYQEEWKAGPMTKAYIMAGDLMVIVPTRSWIDFVVWKNDGFVRQYGLDGLYHDLVKITPSANQLAGCGYLRDGKIRMTYPFFGMRELFRRVYTMLKQYGLENNKDTFMIAHMSDHMIIPHLSFTDAGLDGEQFWGKIKDNYLDVMPLDHIRAEFMGHNYGVKVFMIPQIRDINSSPKLTRQLISLALLHDFNLWPIICDLNEVNKVYRVFDKFGLGNAEFLPYWKNAEFLGGQSDEIKCSAYRKAGGGFLICAANLTRQTQRATLFVAWDQMKSLGELSVEDALSGEKITVAGNKIMIDIPPLDYRLLWIK